MFVVFTGPAVPQPGQPFQDQQDDENPHVRPDPEPHSPGARVSTRALLQRGGESEWRGATLGIRNPIDLILPLRLQIP